MRNSGLKANDLVEKVGVSQPTISKALAGKLNANAPTFRKICILAGISVHASLAGFDVEVAKAFEELWDGTEEHALLIAALLRAAAKLNVKDHPAAS